jgi:deazaflavin-dependent oxidoreductase (nitroreductase family)
MNPMTRLAVVVGRQPWLHRYAGLIVGTDLLIQRLTRGRFNLLTLAGLPEVTLTVRGRRSGAERTTPLLCVPHDGGWLVAGSNWGAPDLPAWVLNLRDAETARVVFRGRTHTVTPHPLTGDERTRAWSVMTATWPNYDLYATRTDREIPVFHLRPAA